MLRFFTSSFLLASLLSTLVSAQLVSAASSSTRPQLPSKPDDVEAVINFYVPEGGVTYYYDEAMELDYFQVSYCVENYDSDFVDARVTLGVTANEVTNTQSTYAAYITDYKNSGCKTYSYILSSFDIGVYKNAYGGVYSYGHEDGVIYSVTATMDVLYDEEGAILYEEDGSYSDVYEESNESDNVLLQDVELTVDNSKDIYYAESGISYEAGAAGEDQFIVSFCQKNYDSTVYLTVDLTVDGTTVRNDASIPNGQTCSQTEFEVSAFLGTEMGGHSSGYYTVTAFLDSININPELYEDNTKSAYLYVSSNAVDFRINQDSPYQGVSYDASSNSFKLDYCIENLSLDSDEISGAAASITVNEITQTVGIPNTDSDCGSFYFPLYEFGIGSTYGQHGEADYEVYAMVDSLNVYPEVNESNNEILETVYVEPTDSGDAVDLEVTGISFDQADDSFKVDYCVQNVEDSDWVGIELDINEEIKDTYFDLPDFGGSGCASVYFKADTFSAISNLYGQHAAGYYDAMATIDYYEAFSEFDESNNVFTAEDIYVTETRMDLSIASVTYNADKDAVDVSYNVSNAIQEDYAVNALIEIEINGRTQIIYVDVTQQGEKVIESDALSYFGVGDEYGHEEINLEVTVIADSLNYFEEPDENNVFSDTIVAENSYVDFYVQSVDYDSATDSLTVEYCAAHRMIEGRVGLEILLNGVVERMAVDVPSVVDGVPSCLTFQSSPLYEFEIGDFYSGHSEGTYSVTAAIDYDDSYPELDEENNDYTESVFVEASEGSEDFNLTIGSITYSDDSFLVEYCGDGLIEDVYTSVDILANGVTQTFSVFLGAGAGEQACASVYSSPLYNFGIGTSSGGHEAQEDLWVQAQVDSQDAYVNEYSGDNIEEVLLDIPDTTVDYPLDLSIKDIWYDAGNSSFNVDFCEENFYYYGTTLANVTLTVEGYGSYTTYPLIQNWLSNCSTLQVYLYKFEIFVDENYTGGTYNLTAEIFADGNKDGVPDSDVEEADLENNIKNESVVVPSNQACEVLNTYYYDEDGDGIGDSSRTAQGCTAPENYVSTSGDNCPYTYNPDQANIDGDAYGDVCDSDRDGDGVSNDQDDFPDYSGEWEDSDYDWIGDNTDQCSNTNPVSSNDTVDSYGCALSQLDSDGDGLSDYVELYTYGTDPYDADTDGDGHGDGVEIAAGSNPLDKNDIPDYAVDTDQDGRADISDNCPSTSNADQSNFDGDTQGDACDDDIDGDGVSNDLDCEDYNTSVGQAQNYYYDEDGDGYGSGSPVAVCPADLNSRYVTNNTDVFPQDSSEWVDTDSDGVGDNSDICPSTTDYSTVDARGCSDYQRDTDGDGLLDGEELNGDHGYVTDPNSSDTDGDGFNDYAEIFTYETNPTDSNDHPLETVVIHSCDVYDDSIYGTWYSSVDAFNVRTDASLYQEGTGSVAFDVDTSLDTSVDWAQMNLYSTNVYDFSDYAYESSFQTWIYIPEIDYFKDFQLLWGTDAGNLWYKTVSVDYQGNPLKEGWNLIEFSWVEGAVGIDGNPDANQVGFFALFTRYYPEYTSQSGFRIDDFKIVD